MNLLSANLRPIAFITLTTIIGFFCGSVLIGFLIGLGIVAFITLLA